MIIKFHTITKILMIDWEKLNFSSTKFMNLKTLIVAQGIKKTARKIVNYFSLI